MVVGPSHPLPRPGRPSSMGPGGAAGTGERVVQPSVKPPLDVEAEQQHVAVLDLVVAAFRAHAPGILGALFAVA